MKNKLITESIKEFSLGILTTAINLSLGMVALSAEMLSAGKNPQAIWKAVESISTTSGVTKDTLKRSVWRAHNQRLLKRKKDKDLIFWTLTDLGKKRLKSLLPLYQSKRPWNKRLYLITYDVPEDKRYHRDQLRKYLIKIGARKFQESVYLILWDPTETLKNFIKSQDLKSEVIISDTGTNGSIGEMDIDELIWKIFNLEELNQRYQDFITHYKSKMLSPAHLAFLYLSILKDDPQLPFVLLGPNWQGEKSYKIFKEITNNTLNIEI